MAGAGTKLFIDGEILDAAEVNTYLQDQVIMRFANAATRDAAFGGVGEPVLAEGMFCYLDDTNVLQSYNGSAWVNVVSSSTPPGLEFIASGSPTNVTTIDITGFTTAYQNFRVVFWLTRHSGSGASAITATLRDASTGYNTGYFGGGVSGNYLGTVASFGQRNNGADFSLGTVYDANSPTRVYFDVGGMNTTVYRTNVVGSGYDPSNTQMISFGYEYAGGRTISPDRIRVTCAVGMTGTWHLYGYRNS